MWRLVEQQSEQRSRVGAQQEQPQQLEQQHRLSFGFPHFSLPAILRVNMTRVEVKMAWPDPGLRWLTAQGEYRNTLSSVVIGFMLDEA